MKVIISLCSLLAVICAAGPATAQDSTPAARPSAAAPAMHPVVLPYLRLRVSSLDASRKFWISTLGGTAVKTQVGEAVRFPNALVFLVPEAPKGGSKGSVVDHVAFEVVALKPVVESLKKAGFTMATRAETNAIYVVTDDVAFLPDQVTSTAVVMGPDDMKVELIENTKLATPIAFRHIHFAAANVSQMKAWCEKALHARVGARGFGFEGLDVGNRRGLLLFTLAGDKVAGTNGRVDDRIGFEVHGAAGLASQLEQQGAKVARPYGKSADAAAMSAVVVDPWGTSIELAEGLTLK